MLTKSLASGAVENNQAVGIHEGGGVKERAGGAAVANLQSAVDRCAAIIGVVGGQHDCASIDVDVAGAADGGAVHGAGIGEVEGAVVLDGGGEGAARAAIADLEGRAGINRDETCVRAVPCQYPCARATDRHLSLAAFVTEHAGQEVGYAGRACQSKDTPAGATQADHAGVGQLQHVATRSVNRAAARAEGEQTVNAGGAAGILQIAAVEHQACGAVVRRANVTGLTTVGQRRDTHHAPEDARDAGTVGVGAARQSDGAGSDLVKPVLPAIAFPGLEVRL